MTIYDQEARYTSDWLLKFANSFKHSSYQDKLSAIWSEKNPFYLLEWLILPFPESMKERIRIARSPGMDRNSTASFEHVFAGQLLFDLVFLYGRSGEEHAAMCMTAMRDLLRLYGAGTWNTATHDVLVRFRQAAEQYDKFRTELFAERQKIDQEQERQLAEIEQEHAGNEELIQLERKAVIERNARKKEEAPRTILHKKYNDSPLVAYMHVRDWTNPSHQLGRFAQWVEEVQQGFHPYERYANGMDNEAGRSDYLDDDKQRLPFLKWVAAYASKSNLSRNVADFASRQRWWSDLLAEKSARVLAEVRQEKQLSRLSSAMNEMLHITFNISGFEQTLLENNAIPVYFHLLVCSGLKHEGHLQWLKESVILRNWDLFLQRFFHSEYSFREMSWILCLDPLTLEQRLLRGAQTQQIAFDRGAVVERCCAVFADGIRSGLAVHAMEKMFMYLAVHDKDTLYRYIQLHVREKSDLDPLLGMDEAYAAALFAGDGVRARAARADMRLRLLEWLRQAGGNDNLRELDPVARIVYPEKSELLLQWLEYFASESEPAMSNGSVRLIRKAEWLADVFEVEWIGLSASTEDGEMEHETVQRWLQADSGSIQFERDIGEQQSGMRYRIVRPGFRDRSTGEIMARAIVRAEWADAGAIADLFEDLKNL